MDTTTDAGLAANYQYYQHLMLEGYKHAHKNSKMLTVIATEQGRRGLPVGTELPVRTPQPA